MSDFTLCDKQWYVIYTRPKCERRVFHQLTSKGINAFLPLRKEIRQWHDRRRKIEMPVFPNYVFAWIGPLERHAVFAVQGFVRFIMTGGVPDTIPQEKMDMLIQILSGEHRISVSAFEVGERVRVVRGPFAGVEGLLVGERGDYKLAMEVSAINQFIVTTISPEDLMKLAYDGALV